MYLTPFPAQLTHFCAAGHTKSITFNSLLLLAAAVVRTAWVPRPIAYLMGLSGLVFLAQGWMVGSEGFSPTMSNAIVLAEVVDVVWMIWLVVIAWRMQDSQPRRLPDEGVGRPDAIHASAR